MSRHVGFVFQDPEAQMVLDTVEAEVAFGLENLAVPSEELAGRVEEVLALLDLVRLRQRPLAELSGGERQRVAIATALVLRPTILALDEPTSQLDPSAAREFLGHVVALQKKLGLTVVLIEQRLERVVQFASRLIYLEDGKITADGPIRDTLELLPESQQPPITRLAQALDWRPVPLTSAEGRRLTPGMPQMPPDDHLPSPARNGRSRPIRSILEAHNIHYSYGDQPVVRGISLTLAEGKATALVGANGSGKSTLLRCLVGLLRPDRGTINLNGKPTAGMSVAAICRQVAYLPQAPDDLLYAETVREELQATLTNHGLKPEIGALDPDELLNELGLGNLAEAYPRDLSVGQRQRVALGAVMITRPKVLLLDEPTRGLDYASKQSLARLWASWREQGMSILLVTHDMELAARVADHVLVLKEGSVDSSGSVADILGTNSLYGSQVARLFPGRGLLTVHDALDKFGD
jgi:energy-coupling factor transport system ATP-binding protein